ncbi:beta-lactamase/transpeptidase-like protein [Polyporus arcularius HHB13444]|uniref:Beta-lactamase/transpeptidase-like protein n=1 Tax=Polyporus arcularius HHB13444 TaxID=1314778 RepID=A0A5C3NR75_9APHY|nr:beta-lactamase/transpeptidase-like protein [Polyporus arcularius HHB13444]
MLPPWLVTLIVLVQTGDAYLSWGVSTQVPLSVVSSISGSVVWEDQPSLSGSRSKSAITPEISAYAEGLLKKHYVPGLSVDVVRVDGDSVVTEFGAWGTMTEGGDATKPDTLFSIGSCSKAFVASAMGIVMDDFAHGRNVTALPPAIAEFTWDTKVLDLLPEDWALDDQWATKKANIRDILTHVSGLTRHDFSLLKDDSPMYLIKRLRYMKQKYELRERWSYNNLMYITASHIISTYSGKPFTEFVKERIFDPLGMTFTTYRSDEAEESKLFSHAWSGADRRRIPYWYAEDMMSQFLAGAGGVLSSATDMTKWLAMLVHGGVNPYTNTTVVPPSVFDEITTAHSIVVHRPLEPSTSLLTGYGMGWRRTSFQGHDLISHAGGIPGFLAYVAFLPEHGLGIAAFANSDGPHSAQLQISLRIIEDLLGLEHTAESDVHLPEHSRPNDPLSARSNPYSSRQLECDAAKSSSLPIARYAGIYHNPGYENFTLCATTTDDENCRRILSDWAAVTPDGVLDPDVLYGEAKHVLYSHVKMQRTGSGDGYESLRLFLVTLFPSGYGQDKTPFVYFDVDNLEGIEVECQLWERSSEVLGCGLKNVEEGPRGTGASIRERADVWFLKLWEM